jgi:hypothetical protein
MKTEPVTMKSTSEMRAVNVSLLCLDDEMHLFPHVSAVSRLKETRAFNPRLLHLDE